VEGHFVHEAKDAAAPRPRPAHTAGATDHYWERASKILITNIRRINSGETPLNLVNQHLGY